MFLLMICIGYVSDCFLDFFMRVCTETYRSHAIFMKLHEIPEEGFLTLLLRRRDGGGRVVGGRADMALYISGLLSCIDDTKVRVEAEVLNFCGGPGVVCEADAY